MNRHERRSAKAMTRGQAVDQVVAVHEAGHAVGRILVADSLGWGVDEALGNIDLYHVRGLVAVQAESRGLQAQAATTGLFFSRPMFEFVNARMPEEIDACHDGAKLLELLTDMRAAGIDVDAWFRAKTIEVVLGPMAEAKLTGKSFEDVFGGDGSRGDSEDLIYYGFISGIAEERLAEVACEHIEIAKSHIARPEVWRRFSPWLPSSSAVE
jgi:hypothetical protein